MLSVAKAVKKVRKKRKINKKNVLVLIVTFILIIGIIGSSVGLVMLGNMMQAKPDLTVNDFVSAESSKIYDQNGNLIGDVGTQIRSNISYEDLPEALVDAFVSIEDSRFFKHNGFDIARFAKSALEVLKARSFVQGGSTLTMQLVKNTYYVDDESGTSAPKKVERKVQEIALAIELEDNVNKQTVLELYLNKVNFGGSGGIRGVQKAAQYYFGKDVGELNTAECAMLAGIVNAPSTFNPFLHLDYATNRRNTVLNMMYYHGYLTKNEYQLLTNIKVEDLLVDPSKQKGTGEMEYAYQSYIDYVIQEAKDITGLDPYSVSMNIYTYMDKDAQTTMDIIQSDQSEEVVFPDDLMEVGMISIDNQTGAIVAIGGGRNYGRGGSMLLNHATDQYKQPGSSVKTILSYALAFEYLGWSTSHVVTDQPMVYTGTDKVIRNANGQYQGQLTLKKAIDTSLNTPAIAALQDEANTIGWSKITEYLQSLGFSSVINNPELVDIQYAIGGSNFTVSCKELAAAHAVMMNGGYYIKPHAIERIEFNNGDAPITPTYPKTSVISDGTAFMISEMMFDVVNGPWQNYMQILKRSYPVYGKTGTTDWGTAGIQYNIPQGAIKDKWMVSETSQYTTAVWVGYEKGVKDADTYFSSAKSQLNLPGHISSLILNSLTKPDRIPTGIAKPDSVTSISHILGTFPYASPIEGMDPAFLTTGYIKKEFAELVPPESQEVEEIANFTAKVDNDGKLNLTWGAYPDKDKLTVAEDKMDLSLSVGSVYVEAWGARLFDYTWLFGPIRYKAYIRSGGNLVQEITSETENFNEAVDLEPGKEYDVCGAYAYENLSKSSNEICQKITAVDSTVTIEIPSRNTSLADATNILGPMAASYGFTLETEIHDSDSKRLEVYVNGILYEGSYSFKQSEANTTVIKIVAYEKHEHDLDGTQETIHLATCDSPALVRYWCSANDGYYTDIDYGEADKSQCQVTPPSEENGD